MSNPLFRSPVMLGGIALFLFLTASLSWVTAPVSSAPENAANELVTIVLQTDTELVRVVQLTTNDIVYNSADNKIYASQPSSAGSTGNSIISLNPQNGAASAPVFVGSEPNKLALAADGRTLYVSLDGAFSVRRFDTVTQSAGAQFSLGYNSTGRFRLTDMAVSPDNPNVVAIGRHYPFVSPPGAGVVIFDNGVQLPLAGPGSSDSTDYLAFSGNGATLYGTGIYSGLRAIGVNGNGATVLNTSTLASGAPIKFANGRLYSSLGQIIDASNRTLLGTFPQAAAAAFVPDPAVGRAYYLVRDSMVSTNWILKAFDLDSFALIGSLTISNVAGEATSLIRWGTNGLAFRTSANQLYLIQTTLIPSEEPIPAPTATPAPSPTATPTPFATSARAVPIIGNNLLYHPATQKIYVSVPSRDGSGGNTLATIEPDAGAIENRVFVGSEPNKLALAADGQTLYVALEGAHAIRKFDLAAQTAGQQFPVGIDSSDGPLRTVDFAASPGNPNLVAVSRCSNTSSPCYRGVAVYENGIMRPQIRGDSYSLDFSPTTSTLYGSSSFLGGLEVMTVDANGITGYSKMQINSATRIKYSNGLVYSSRGQVVNPATQAIVGTFPLGNAASSNPSFVVDEANNKIFFLVNSGQIQAFDLDTFLPVGLISVPGATGAATDLERWGTNGLAVSYSNGPVILLRSALVDPSETVPTTTPSPTPTPSPSPTAIPTFIRRINLPVNDVVHNAADGMLYTSVPNYAEAARANTITRLNPQSGEILSSVLIGNDPGKLALSADGSTLYASLNGTYAVRRFDIPSQTPGLQFSLSSSYVLVRDLAVLPENSQSVIVSTGGGGAAVYDDGVRRPDIPLESGSPAPIGPLEFSASPNILYGYNNTHTGFELYKLSLDANGLNRVGTTRNLISGFGVDMKSAGGKIFTNNGRIVNPENNTLVGTLQSETPGYAVAVDEALGRIFIVSMGTISAYDINTFVKIGSISCPTSGTPANLVRWGVNGLAFRVHVSSDESYLNIVQSDLVTPGASMPTGLHTNALYYQTYESASSALITVTRTGDLSGTTTVEYETTDGTAVAGSDYRAMSGTLAFAPGESVKSLAVPLINDTVYEGTGETFTLTLRNPTGNNVNLLFPSSTTVTILDNDQRPHISDQNASVNETRAGSSAAAQVSVRLTNPSVETVTVNYATADGTATAGLDYQPASGTLTFNPLETMKTVTIQINGDNLPENDETFFVDLSSPINGTVLNGRATVTIVNFVPQSADRPKFDFDGDGKTDISIFRPSVAEWWYQRSSDNQVPAFRFGDPTDKIMPADYTGDGRADAALFRSSTSEWFVLRSEDGSYYSFPFGTTDDVPVVGDFDADGKADPGVFRPSSATWYVLLSDGGILIRQFGAEGDVPVVEDYDGDGKSDLAVFRNNGGSGEWWHQRSSDDQVRALQFGVSSDKPAAADFTGDGRADVAVWRAASGEWFILRSEDGSYYSFPFGASDDIPTVGDYDGDGRADAAVFRRSNTTWYIQRSTSDTAIVQFGNGDDLPVPSAFGN